MVELDTFSGFNGYSTSEMLRQVALIDRRLLNNFSLGNGVLVEVFTDGLSNKSLIPPEKTINKQTNKQNKN